MRDGLATIKAVVDDQAEDEGLWALPFPDPTTQPVVEAYLQQELRRLHAVVEAAIAEDTTTRRLALYETTLQWIAEESFDGDAAKTCRNVLHQGRTGLLPQGEPE